MPERKHHCCSDEGKREQSREGSRLTGLGKRIKFSDGKVLNFLESGNKVTMEMVSGAVRFVRGGKSND